MQVDFGFGDVVVPNPRADGVAATARSGRATTRMAVAQDFMTAFTDIQVFMDELRLVPHHDERDG